MSVNYTVFHDHITGNSHIKMGLQCEDCSAHFSDLDGRFAIAVICDGHSDPKSFRSERGAKLGCETVIDVMRRFFESYYEDETADALKQLLRREESCKQRLRTAIVSGWNQRVREDLRSNPIRPEELAPLDCPQFRSTMKQYQAGKWLSNIYGATMVAAALCEDNFCLCMHIGDGVVVELEAEGNYMCPLPIDDREDILGPASLCDTDLLSREKAFRMRVLPFLPQAMFVTCDGVGDMPLTLEVKENLCVLQRGLMDQQNEPETQTLPKLRELGDAQKEYLHSFLEYHSKRRLEDDCSLSGFYRNDKEVQEVRVSAEELELLFKALKEQEDSEEKRYQEAQKKVSGKFQEIEGKLTELTMRREQERKKIRDLEERLGICSEELRVADPRIDAPISPCERVTDSLEGVAQPSEGTQFLEDADLSAMEGEEGQM